MRLREIQGILTTILNTHDIDSELPKEFIQIIDDARETIVDMLAEGISRDDILEALLELLMIATILGIDIEEELSKIFGGYATVSS